MTGIRPSTVLATYWGKITLVVVTSVAMVLSLVSPASASTARQSVTLHAVTFSVYETTHNDDGVCSAEIDDYWSGPGNYDALEKQALSKSIGSLNSYGSYYGQAGRAFFKIFENPRRDCNLVPDGITTRTLVKNANPTQAARSLRAADLVRPDASGPASSLYIAMGIALGTLALTAAIIAVATFAAPAELTALLVAFAGCVGGAGAGAIIALLTGNRNATALSFGAVAGCAAGGGVGIVIGQLPRIAAAVSGAFARYAPQTATVVDQVLEHSRL